LQTGGSDLSLIAHRCNPTIGQLQTKNMLNYKSQSVTNQPGSSSNERIARFSRFVAKPFAIVTILVLLVYGGACRHKNYAPLRIGANVWPGYEGLYLARSLGYFDDKPIQLVDYPSSQEVIRALQNGAIEVAALTGDEALQLADNGHDPAIVLVMDYSNGADVILAKPRFNSMSDLRGKRIGFEENALGAFMVARSLEKNGMTIADIVPIPVLLQDHERAFLDGTVDAIATFEPIRGRLMSTGAKQVFDSSQIPGEVVDVLVVRKSLLDNPTDTLDAVIRDWFRAFDYQKKNPADAARRVSMREGVKPEQFLEIIKTLEIPDLQSNQRLLSKSDTALAVGLKQISRIMVRNKLLKKEVVTETLLDDRFVRRLP
jgi:NitT/TauT family transport system substrate-binding protein